MRDIPKEVSSCRRFITKITSRSAVDSAMYSASVVDSAMVVCILEDQIIGQPAYQMINPVRE